MAARHDINSNQGETLNLHLLYTDSNGSVIDLSGYTAEMQVRRSSVESSTLLYLRGNTGGFLGATFGISGGSGGIYLNRNVGNTGVQTGGVLILGGATGTSLIPRGRHLYDLEIDLNGSITRLIEGRFESTNEVTR